MATPMKAFQRYLSALEIGVVAASSGTTQARGYLPAIKQQITDMAVNGSGIRDTARVLKISPTTVIEELKKTSAATVCEQNAISAT